MCGRYSALTEDEIIEIREILKKLSLHIVRDEFLEYNEENGEICPTDFAPVIVKNEKGIYFEKLKWGFKKWDDSGVIINARCETIKIRSTFSNLIKSSRCIVPTTGFFEWEKLKKGKKKHFIKDKKDNILFMAGLYRDTTDGREFVIITKKAFNEMENIHDRMPVILKEEQIEAWLSGKLSAEDLEKLDFDVKIAPHEEKSYDNGQMSLF